MQNEYTFYLGDLADGAVVYAVLSGHALAYMNSTEDVNMQGTHIMADVVRVKVMGELERLVATCDTGSWSKLKPNDVVATLSMISRFDISEKTRGKWIEVVDNHKLDAELCHLVAAAADSAAGTVLAEENAPAKRRSPKKKSSSSSKKRTSSRRGVASREGAATKKNKLLKKIC